jgi:hypothetical protein
MWKLPNEESQESGEAKHGAGHECQLPCGGTQEQGVGIGEQSEGGPTQNGDIEQSQKAIPQHNGNNKKHNKESLKQEGDNKTPNEKQLEAEQSCQKQVDESKKKCGLFQVFIPYGGILLALLSAILMTTYTTMIKFLDQMDSMQVNTMSDFIS